MKRLKLFVILSIFLLAACATAKKNAIKALEAGNFEDAVNRFEQLVAKDPADPELQTGLTQARSGFISQKLIQVRNARLANNPGGALDLLLLVQAKEQAWQTSPAGAVAFTQDEELQFGLAYAKNSLNSSIKNKLPLQGSSFIKKYGTLFPARELTPFVKQLGVLGKGLCSELRGARKSDHPYFDLLTNQICQLYGEKGVSSPDTISPSLFSDIDYNISVTSDTPEFQGMLQRELIGGLQRSAWYDPNGKKRAKADITGSFHFINDRRHVERVHNYSETEHYTEKVAVQRNGQTVEESQNKTRMVPRRYRYYAWDFNQEISVGATGNLALDGHAIPLSLSNRDAASGIEHNENNSSIGLTPSHPRTINASDWLLQEVRKLGDDLARQAADLWIAQFCRTDLSSEGSLADIGNRVQQCLRQRTSVPVAYAEAWFQKQFGLGVIDGERLLGSRP